MDTVHCQTSRYHSGPVGIFRDRERFFQNSSIALSAFVRTEELITWSSRMVARSSCSDVTRSRLLVNSPLT